MIDFPQTPPSEKSMNALNAVLVLLIIGVTIYVLINCLQDNSINLTNDFNYTRIVYDVNDK